jgi:hypothetical protein
MVPAIEDLESEKKRQTDHIEKIPDLGIYKELHDKILSFDNITVSKLDNIKKR